MNSFFYFILFYFLYFLFYLFCLNYVPAKSFLDFKIIDYKLNNNNFNLSDSDYYEFILLNDGLI
jgi:hypothetical protein